MTVTAVKRAPLANYRIVYFATHGLVMSRAWQSRHLPSPCRPNQPKDHDNGLLKASEVAQLKLNADWVAPWLEHDRR